MDGDGEGIWREREGEKQGKAFSLLFCAIGLAAIAAVTLVGADVFFSGS